MDYGVGNLRSVVNAFTHIGADAIVSGDRDILAACDKIVFPGVGAFGYGIKSLCAKGLNEFVLETIEKAKPLLGICVGMQLLHEGSTEFGQHKGLGVVTGTIERFDETSDTSSAEELRLPHVGWTHITPTQNNSGMVAELLSDVTDTSKFYFVHSYKSSNDNKAAAATATYGNKKFAAVVAHGSAVGTQFHPEKSGPDGLALLKNFARI
jgi:glutamine amidotransferase